MEVVREVVMVIQTEVLMVVTERLADTDTVKEMETKTKAMAETEVVTEVKKKLAIVTEKETDKDQID